MKRFVYFLLTMCLFASCSGISNVKLSSSSSSVDSVSYAIGVLEGSYMQEWLKNVVDVDITRDYLYKGIEDAILRRDTITKLDRQWAERTVTLYMTNKKAEKARLFLENNQKNDSVIVLESGLQYKVLDEGTGISPTISDTINFKYKGSLVSGEIFDVRTDPIKMPLQMLIKGWQEGIPLMKEGAKYVFYIPSNLAYGDSGRLGGETLIFEVELVNVIKGNAAKENE